MEPPPPRDTSPSQSSAAAAATSAVAAVGNLRKSDQAFAAVNNPFAPSSPVSVFGTKPSPFNAAPGLKKTQYSGSARSGKKLGSSTGHTSHFLRTTVDSTTTHAFGATSTSASCSGPTSLVGASSSCTAIDSCNPGLASSEITAHEITASGAMSTSPSDASCSSSPAQGVGSSGTAPAAISPSAKSSSCFGGQTNQFGGSSSRIKKCLGLDRQGTSMTPYTKTPHDVEPVSVSAMPEDKDKIHEELTPVSAMPEDKNKIHEKLRHEDYKLRNKVWCGLLCCRGHRPPAPAPGASSS